VSHPRTFSPDRLRAARKRANLNRETLALCIGRTVVSVGNYERGTTVPPEDVLAQLARILGVSPDELLEDGARVG